MTQKHQQARTLSGRHINMIALGGTIGTGLFLGAGGSIQKVGLYHYRFLRFCYDAGTGRVITI